MKKIAERLANHALKTRTVYIWNEIEEETAGYVIQRMEYHLSQNKDPIYLLIHSPGGSVAAEGAIVDEMQAIQAEGVEVRTICAGIAHSAAGVVLAMGTKGHRYIRPRATVMLHPASYGLTTDYGAMQEKVAEFFKKTEIIANREVAAACGKTNPKDYRKFMRDMEKGLWLTAKEAIDYGIADEIWRTTLPKGADDAEKVCV